MDLFRISLSSKFYWTALGFIHPWDQVLTLLRPCGFPEEDSPARRKVAALPLDLQHHVTQGAVQSCGHALLREGGRMHLSKTLIPCAQKNQLCTRYFSSFQESFDLPRVFLPALSVPKIWEMILALKETRLWHWAGFETSALGCRWRKCQCDTSIVVLWSLGSNLQNDTWMLHPHITFLLDTEFLICFLLAFRDILRLSTVSVKCSKMFVVYGPLLFHVLIYTELKPLWRKWTPQHIPKQKS